MHDMADLSCIPCVKDLSLVMAVVGMVIVIETGLNSLVSDSSAPPEPHLTDCQLKAAVKKIMGREPGMHRR